ncbi:alpha/beta hydrolase family protein [Alteromonas gracilis]|uniref:alpha/beta hydrolase family protein n=1 Tax=Alteromonas gracilis TaxID=1479524 RepID=UPI003734EC3B
MNRLFFTVLLFITVFTARASEHLPLEYFIKHGDYLNLSLSPDGKHIAARVQYDGRIQVAILQTEDMKVVGGIRPSNKDIIHTVNWVSNERILYEYAEKQTNLDSPVPTGELYAMNIDGSQRELLYGYRASDARTGSRLSTKDSKLASQEILSFLEDDDRNILIAEYPWSRVGNIYYDDHKRAPVISKLDIFTGKKRKVEVLPHGHSRALATNRGEVRFMSWMDEDNNAHSAYRKDNDSEWIPLEKAFEEVEGLFPLGLSDDNKFVYLSGRYGPEEIYTLYSLNLETGEYKRIFSDHATDIEDYILDKNSMPAVGITFPNTSDYVYATTKSRIGDVHKMLTDAFKGQTVKVVSRTKDEKTLLVHVSSDVNPGEYYLFDSQTLGARFIWANSSWIDPRTLVKMQPIVVPTQDGEQVHGYITLPPGKSAEQKPPLVVVIHGGPHQAGTRDFWDYDAETQLLANRGYAVLRVNFRGSDGYGKRFERLGYREWGGAMIKDVNDAVKWSIEQGYVDGNRVCAYGASYGGYAALMAAVREPELYQCTVGYVGIYDLNYMHSESDIPTIWGGESYLEKVIGSDPAALAEFSPINHADEIKANVMLIHGSKDRRVPEINAEALSEKLTSLRNAPVYLQYSQAGHGVYDEGNRQELYQGLLDFLSTNLK